MKFIWDEAKRRTNLAKHGFDFVDAEIVFAGNTFTVEDDRFDCGEDRYITFGMLYGRVVVVAHAERDDKIRIISIRKASRYEQRLYFQNFTN